MGGSATPTGVVTPSQVNCERATILDWGLNSTFGLDPYATPFGVESRIRTVSQGSREGGNPGLSSETASRFVGEM
jgi:hypothetical protein